MIVQTPTYSPASVENLTPHEFTTIENWLDALTDGDHCLLSSYAYQCLLSDTDVYSSISPATRDQLLAYGYLGELKQVWKDRSLNVKLFTDAYLEPDSPNRIFAKKVEKHWSGGDYWIVDSSYIVIHSDRQKTLENK